MVVAADNFASTLGDDVVPFSDRFDEDTLTKSVSVYSMWQGSYNGTEYCRGLTMAYQTKKVLTKLVRYMTVGHTREETGKNIVEMILGFD